MIFNNSAPPGLYSGDSATAFPPILDTDRNADWVDGGRMLDGSSQDWSNPTSPSLHRPGVILGKIAATGTYANALLGITTATAASGATSITIGVAQAAAVVARIGTSGTLTLVGPPTAGGIVATSQVAFTAVNTGTGAIATAATTAAYVQGTLVLAADGSLPVALLGGGTDYGLSNMTVGGARRLAQIPRLIVAGQIVSKNVPGLLNGDASSIAWLKGQLNSGGRRFIWNDEY